MTAESKIACGNLWRIFGPQPKRIRESLDPGLSKEEIREKTGHVLAVRACSFDVGEGEVFVVMGLSGSGKSTLVRCISRLIEPTDGQITVDGQDVMAMDEEQLRELRRHKMSMVFQHFGLFPHRRAIDNVAYGLEVQGVDKASRRKKAQETLDLVGLSGWERCYPRELSGGMQQRVGLARALAVDPEILLFDEPFSALDPLIRREMQDELINLQKTVRKTILFVTHDFLEALKLGDRIAIMKDGEFVQVGTPEEVVAQPVNDYVREFTKDVPRSMLLTAGTIMRRFPLAVRVTDDLQGILTSMQGESSAVAFVQGERDEFLGVLWRADVTEAVDQGKSEAETLITNNLPVAYPDTKLEDLIPITAANDTPIPVVDKSNKLLGCVDRSSVMLALGG